MSNTDYNKLIAAIANLQKAYKILQLVQENKFPSVQGLEKHDFEQAHKTSVVKCFEICCDTMWKHLRKHLEESRGIQGIRQARPNDIFLKAHEVKTIKRTMANSLSKYWGLRNDAAHDYALEKADAVLAEVENFIRDVTELYKIMIEKE